MKEAVKDEVEDDHNGGTVIEGGCDEESSIDNDHAVIGVKHQGRKLSMVSYFMKGEYLRNCLI